MSSPEKRIETSRVVAAPADRIFALLCDPQGHVAIDGSGMLQDADGDPVTAVGDRFVVHMDREPLGDLPMGRYDVEVVITAFEQDREIAWTVIGRVRPPIGHVYGYRLEPHDEGTRVTSCYDWSQARQDLVDSGILPVLGEQALRATLGILDRTVRRAQAGTASSDGTPPGSPPSSP